MKRALVFLALAAGCSFPTIDRVVPADGSSSNDGTSSETAVDDSSNEDSTLEDSTFEDSTEMDSATDTKVPDVSLDGADVGTCPVGAKNPSNPCDCDGDGYPKKGVCTGTDCDDNDDRAHPGAGFLTAMPTPVTGGDWNCDGKVDKQFKDGISCGLLGDCTVTGFTDKPACGAMGTFTTCKVVPLGCATNTTKSDYQGCK